MNFLFFEKKEAFQGKLPYWSSSGLWLDLTQMLLCLSGDPKTSGHRRHASRFLLIDLMWYDWIRDKWEITPSNSSLLEGLLPWGAQTNPCLIIPPRARSPEPRQSNPGSTAWKCGWHLRRKSASRSSSPFSSPTLLGYPALLSFHKKPPYLEIDWIYMTTQVNPILRDALELFKITL
jgi:hypothetical protein